MKKHAITVFDPSTDKVLSKKIWLLIGGGEYNINHIVDFQVRVDAPSAELLILNLDYIKLQEVASVLGHYSCAAMGVTRLVDGAGERLSFLAAGLDQVFDWGDLESPHFSGVLHAALLRARRDREKESALQDYDILKAALAITPDAFIIFDRDKKLVFASEHYKRFYKSVADKLLPGLSVEEAYDLMAGEHGVYEGSPLYKPTRDFWHSLYGQIEITLNTGQTLRITARNLKDNKGTIVTTTDITVYIQQKKELEAQSEQIKIALKKEQDSSAIQKQFISMVSHEFRTPLTIIDGNAQILEKRGGELEAAIVSRRSKTIRSAVSRLIALMEGILSSNMLNTGYMELIKSRFNLKSLIEELAQEQADLTPALVISAKMDGVPEEIFLDKKMMVLILSNLISNAVKFGGETPTVEINGTVKDGILLLQLSDNGIGIPEADQPRVFERFYRASNSTGITGTGIGLSLVKELVEMQGGSIKMVSIVAVGTTFYLTFPLDDADRQL